MQKPKRADEVVQFFCSKCGDTRTYLVTDPRVTTLSEGNFDCRACLQGKMLQKETA